jgi:hypothetical protein
LLPRFAFPLGDHNHQYASCPLRFDDSVTSEADRHYVAAVVTLEPATAPSGADVVNLRRRREPAQLARQLAKQGEQRSLFLRRHSFIPKTG